MKVKAQRLQQVGVGIMSPGPKGSASKHRPGSVFDVINRSHLFNDADKAFLEYKMEALNKKHKARFTYFISGVDSMFLMCNSPEELNDRVLGIVNVINLMSGLILSAMAGVALEPYAVEELPPNMQILGDVYNVIGGFSVTLQFCMCMYSSFMLMFMYSTPNKIELTYFFVLRGGMLFGIWATCLFLPNIGVFVMISIAMIINSSTIGGFVASGVVWATFLGVHMIMVYFYSRMFPAHVWAYAPMATGGALFLSGRLRDESKKVKLSVC